ncbi:glycine zipper family protein [Nitrosomonas mobilis]|uniref:glycine zipper family protein n=1 Tax=Nitrosomonas mobilis TaxID=51642 RepID=UPI000AC6951E|nr:glycine zipper family protein [Nitrosomonas mobilis]HNO75861.1 glycine zipper family protein [Nitrosomonas mobilis]
MINKPGKTAGIGIVLLGLSACANHQPILYPNTYYQSVGRTIADRDINECRQLAESAGARRGSGSTGNTARRTVVGAGAGAASGAVGGAIAGSAGRGAMVGAASGATYGLLSGVFGSGTSRPAPAYMNFVNRCLRERGYEVTGWQ